MDLGGKHAVTRWRGQEQVDDSDTCDVGDEGVDGRAGRVRPSTWDNRKHPRTPCIIVLNEKNGDGTVSGYAYQASMNWSEGSYSWESVAAEPAGVVPLRPLRLCQKRFPAKRRAKSPILPFCTAA
jgi:hypothetical protein